MSNRIAKRFAALKEQNRKGLVTFITAGDPDRENCENILMNLPRDGADFIELGMPFSDPMADGPAIQDANRRALTAGATLRTTLNLVKSFRASDTQTPIILMGYYNPIYAYGTERFVKEASDSGVDGLIVVDLPPEEDSELYEPARNVGIDIIRLVTPATPPARLQTILERASGFIYYVSITGVTGTAKGDTSQIRNHVAQIRKCTSLPLAIGFGISNPDDVRLMGPIADAVVVGSAIVKTIGALQEGSKSPDDLQKQIGDLAAAL